MSAFDVLFSLTIYRNGQVRLTTANGRRDPALITATLRDIALAVEAGALILSEYDDEEFVAGLIRGDETLTATLD
jgi:hypothetical protein